MSYEQGQYPCPKCRSYSVNPDVCDACGALISRINSRENSYEQPTEHTEFQETPPILINDEPSEGPSFTKIALVLTVIAVGGFFYFGSRDKTPAVVAEPVLAGTTAPRKIETANANLQDSDPVPPQKLLNHAEPAPAATATPASPDKGAEVLGQVLNLFTEKKAFVGAVSPKPATVPIAAVSSATPAAVQTPAPAVQPSPAASGKRDLGVITIGEADIKTGSYSTLASKPAAGSPVEPESVELPPEPAKEVASVPAPRAAAAAQTKLGTVSTVDTSSFKSEVLRHRESPVLVDFYATWCGPCKVLAPRVAAMAMQHGDDLKVVKMDVDKNDELRRKYNVDAFPTLVLFRNGREVKRLVGVYSLSDLDRAIKPHL